MKVNKFPIYYILVTMFIQAVLISLKVTNIIKWDWVLVVAPLWAPYLLFTIGGAILCIYLIICDIKGRIFDKKNEHS